VCTEHSVDPYHHRALRASQGTAFHVPFRIEASARSISNRLPGLGYRPIGLSPRGDVPLTSLDPRTSYALFFGSGKAWMRRRSRACRPRCDSAARGYRVVGVAAAASGDAFLAALNVDAPEKLPPARFFPDLESDRPRTRLHGRTRNKRGATSAAPRFL
jgi:hypothetical protein